ncbi:stationary phase growth adaptation protein [Plesiomonas shigelloides]|uniref:stationary phase growth adaptation protein n=1 Tax=Plesiomonas shigelloides TaxID=703 RepID=UPI001E5750F8|nr:stationary phase growth adaptation protein [Plesiomonas shigelloides]
MNIVSEVTKWRAFQAEDGELIDLSFLDAHKVSYEFDEGDGDITSYDFYVTYSYHCFAKEYAWQSDDEKARLMYFAPKDARPFCYTRYGLARRHLRNVIENLPACLVLHAGYGSYAATEILTETGEKQWYFVPFKVFRERKKYRIHVTSAYPVTELPKTGKVRFQSIAKNLRQGKPLPRPRGR